MAKSKTAPSLPLVPGWLQRLVGFAWGPGRTATMLVLLVAAFIAATCWAWTVAQERVQSAPRYKITQQQVKISPLPPWIHSDLRAEVFRNASLDAPLSKLDDGLNDRLGRAFALHPWVAKVVQVTKWRPDLVEVQLVYRRPVCVVEVPGDLLPVDAEGVLLPGGDFSPNEKQAQYLRLGGIPTRPMGPAGQAWGDGRVTGGAEIADSLGSVWQQLKLFRIEPAPRPGAAAGEECPYVLFTNAGTQIVWGYAPSTRMANEMPAAEKVARLMQFAADHGGLEGPTGPQALDVRLLPAARGKR